MEEWRSWFSKISPQSFIMVVISALKWTTCVKRGLKTYQWKMYQRYCVCQFFLQTASIDDIRNYFRYSTQTRCSCRFLTQAWMHICLPSAGVASLISQQCSKRHWECSSPEAEQSFLYGMKCVECSHLFYDRKAIYRQVNLKISLSSNLASPAAASSIFYCPCYQASSEDTFYRIISEILQPLG